MPRKPKSRTVATGSRAGSRITHEELEERGYVRIDLHVPPKFVPALDALVRAYARAHSADPKRSRPAAIFEAISAAYEALRKKNEG